VGTTLGLLDGAHRGGDDAYVRKYDASGALQWTRQFGTGSYDRAIGVAADAGRVVVVGTTGGNLQGGNLGSGDAFVRAYGLSGDLLWTHQFGTGVRDEAWRVALAGAGTIFVSGITDGAFASASAGSTDVFVRALDANGVPTWTRQFGTGKSDANNGLGLDAAGIVYATVTYEDAVGSLARFTSEGSALTPIPLISPLALSVGADGELVSASTANDDTHGPHAGATDALVERVAADGTRRWIRQFGTSSVDFAMGVHLLPDGGAIVVGSTDGSLVGSSAGRSDVFVRRYGP
jgi:hypothetical protein